MKGGVLFFCPDPPHPSPTGLQAQVENMTNKWSVFMTMDGRISMAGLSGGLQGGGVGAWLCANSQAAPANCCCGSAAAASLAAWTSALRSSSSSLLLR